MLSRPIECPGATVPPGPTVRPPSVPLPTSVPPLTVTAPTVPSTEKTPPCTVNGEFGSDAVAATFSRPCSTFQDSAALVLPVSVQVALSTLLKVLKPWYCAAGPILLTSNESAPVPPSWNVSLPVPTTLPVIA
jgi:hypothetical protein